MSKVRSLQIIHGLDSMVMDIQFIQNDGHRDSAGSAPLPCSIRKEATIQFLLSNAT